MKQRLRYSLLILEFALRTLIMIWREWKTVVTWQRNFKDVSLHVTCYNHLFDDEIPENIEEVIKQHLQHKSRCSSMEEH